MTDKLQTILRQPLIITISFLLVACSTNPATPTQEISDVPPATEQAATTDTSTPPPETPAFPTNTPVPTATDPPIETPSVQPTATPTDPATATPTETPLPPQTEPTEQPELSVNSQLSFTSIPQAEWDQIDIDMLHEQIFAALLARNPERATELGLSDYYGIGNTQLTNISDSYRQETYQLIQTARAALQQIDRTNLTPEQARSTDIFIWDLENRLRGQEFSHHDYLVRQLFSPHADLPSFMAFTHPLNTQQDAEDYITRLTQFPEKFDQIITAIQIRAEEEILPPRFVFDIVLSQLRDFVSPPPEQNLIYTGFAARLAEIETLSEAEKKSLQNGVLVEIENSVYPAYNALADYLNGLRNEATTDDGVWKLPDGEAYYAYALRTHTTTDLTPEEIHEMGRKEVERIQQKIRAGLSEMGYSDDLSVGSRQFYQNGNIIRISTEADRTEAIKIYEESINKAETELGHLFNIRPRNPLEVHPVPEFQKGSPAYYSPPPLDGSRPGIFFLPLDEGSFIFVDGVPTLAHHEAIPGHHFQLAIQKEAGHLPTFRRALEYTAFTEGWALYTERLASEEGLYDDNPRGELARLIQSDLFRAARLVVDTGIHHLGWTREEAMAYMTEATGFAWTSEVERYIVWPGQATGYKVGELTILRLRDEAKIALGDQFDLAEFHTVILQSGNVPLTILADIVHDYINEKLQE